ncbi:hypothetical protein BD289DRAFT_431311 [Coniella lustricola]|uniref:Secreted protein n=1 Tax=Coniella lustricola TaxID=2025994 RepID=A0A2T3AAZ4_9PEZI|nr:hypothetical protein BD289DRAFT_431311 [Coniella lustricola]
MFFSFSLLFFGGGSHHLICLPSFSRDIGLRLRRGTLPVCRVADYTPRDIRASVAGGQFQNSATGRTVFVKTTSILTSDMTDTVMCQDLGGERALLKRGSHGCGRLHLDGFDGSVSDKQMCFPGVDAECCRCRCRCCCWLWRQRYSYLLSFLP